MLHNYRLELEEVPIEGGGYYWQHVAAALLPGASQEELLAALPYVLFWEKVGRLARVPVLPGGSTSDGDDGLLVIFIQSIPI